MKKPGAWERVQQIADKVRGPEKAFERRAKMFLEDFEQAKSLIDEAMKQTVRDQESNEKKLKDDEQRARENLRAGFKAAIDADTDLASDKTRQAVLAGETNPSDFGVDSQMNKVKNPGLKARGFFRKPKVKVCPYSLRNSIHSLSISTCPCFST